jgi:NADPH:quinone reductase-like Zn-dependent oxidoreductase
MKAVRIHEHGGADSLRYEEVPDPVAGHGEVVVRIGAAALNHLDLFLRDGMKAVPIPLPRVLGSDGAGTVESAGPGVTNVKPGDRVLLAPGVGCGTCADCLSGRDNVCPRYTLFGYFRDGTYAERIAVPAANAIPIPGTLSFEEAASIPLVFLTAWHMLVSRAAVRAGETVLVMAAGSGVGIAGVQLARVLGARVIATAGSDEKLEKARALGAHETVNYATHDLTAEVRRRTGKRGVDVVFEHVGGGLFEKALACLARNGRLVTCGATSGYDVRVDLRFLFSKHQSCLGSYMGGKGELVEVLRLFEAGSVRPVVDRVFPLAGARDAHRWMEERRNFGKIVLVP